VPEERDVAENVLSAFEVQCQHINNEVCFVPTNAVQRFVDQCTEGKLVLAHGEVYRPEGDDIPVVAMVQSGVYDRLLTVASRNNLTVQELIGSCISSLLGDESIIKSASAEELEEESDVWMEGEDSPPEPWNFYGTPSEEKNPVIQHQENYPTYNELRQDSISKLNSVMSEIHRRREGSIEVWVGLHDTDELSLNLKYPHDGFSVKDKWTGPIGDCFSSLVERLEKWSAVAFAPKLEEGEEVQAKMDVEIVGFNRERGQYEARLGNATVWLDPEAVERISV
jgi:hypothetical protein